MENEDVNQEESAPKRIRCNYEIKIDVDVSYNSDSGQQSSLQETKENQQITCSSGNKIDSGKTQICNNGDSGLSFKMEETSSAAADITEIAEGNEDGNKMTDRRASKSLEEDKDHHMLTNENIEKHEHSDPDQPSTSTALIKRYKRNRSRNYRIAGQSSSSLDSSAENNVAIASEQPQEEPESLENMNSASDTAVTVNNNSTEAMPPLLPYLGDFNESSNSSSSLESSFDSNDLTDSEHSLFRDRLSPDYESNDSMISIRLKQKEDELNAVLDKQKPAYNWLSSYEVMRREHGLSGDGKISLRNGFSCSFNKRFYASRHVVERMQISHVLRKHTGCVNCVNFNKSGELLVTGSDDSALIVWDWAGNKVKKAWRSGHSANIFQSKFLPTSSCIDIISTGRDGKVRRSIVPPSGGKVQISKLYSHTGAVHKLVICPDNPSEILSVGEDGRICNKDLRDDSPSVDIMKKSLINKRKRKVCFYSISHHPFAPEICVSGSDQYVRVYDKRSMQEPVHLMAPEHILEKRSPNVTCCVYNNTGTEILATYSEDNIYLFDNKNYVPGKYLHSYRGHFNQKTIKGVNFFGPNSEYVISGSDCGNIFYWDKKSEAILNFMPGDTAGVVNCLEPHPTTPILATSGLDHDIKIWTPSAEKYPPDLTKLTSCVKRNLRRADLSNRDFDGGQMHFFIRQTLCRHRANRRNRHYNVNDLDTASISSADTSISDVYTEPESSDDEDDDDDDGNLRALVCGTQ